MNKANHPRSLQEPPLKKKIKAALNTEMHAAKNAYEMAAYDTAFAHLERAHILGQQFFFQHWISHWWMLKIGRARKDTMEIRG